MAPRQEPRRRQRVPARGSAAHPVRDTLDAARLPNFAPKPELQQTRPRSGTFRVPSPTDSEEEEIQRIESGWTQQDRLPAPTTGESNFSFNIAENVRDPLSTLGDSSSLFSNTSPASPPAQIKAQQAFQPGQSKPIGPKLFEFDSPPSSTMVVEREPPKTTPQKPLQPVFENVKQPEFGRPSPLQNRLQTNNVFNVPKPSQPRPEHHRPAPTAEKSNVQLAREIAHRVVEPFRSHPPVQQRRDPDVIEIPRPANTPAWNNYPRPAPTYSSFNAPTSGFAAVNANQRPFVDLTKPQNLVNPDAALFDDRFGATDPYMYVDAEKANENIKALLEGAFEDEEDKPRTRGRKKKIDAAVAGLTDKLKGLDVKADENKENHTEEEDEEGEDDGTVEGLSVKLLPHQVDGVAWMKDKEVGVKKKNGVLPKGGILADDMGNTFFVFFLEEVLWS